MLSSKTGVLYKGFTNNIYRRIRQHSDGQVSSTKNMLPLELIHVELSSSRKEARELEIFFKSGYGREVIKEIIEENKR